MSSHIILVNATTLNKGGALQAAVAFIRVLLEDIAGRDGIEWILAVSPEVRDQLASFGHILRDHSDICLEKSPAKSLRSRKILQRFGNTQADAVFTFFGPSYVSFRVPHLCGVADGWVTHAGFLAYTSLPRLIDKIKMVALCCYKALWLRRADAWVVEEESARQGLVKRLQLPPSKITLVPNNGAPAYIEYNGANRPARNTAEISRILCFASYYPHKCLELIPHIAACLVKNHGIRNFKFILTVPHEDYSRSMVAKQVAILGVEAHVENIGYVALKDGPALYQRCDLSLLPTILETFSATYPESMLMGLPIVTSDLDFARSVCGDAALYFTPLSPTSAANQLALLLLNEHLRIQQIKKGLERVAQFPSAREKYQRYSNIMLNLLKDLS